MIAWTDVVALWPDTGLAAGDEQNAILAVVEIEMDADTWGDLFEIGQAHLAAHHYQLGQLRGRGPVTAETIGPASQSFASLVGQGEASYLLTPAGREWQRLTRGLPTAFGFLS